MARHRAIVPRTKTLKPIARAYLLAYISVAGPKACRLFYAYARSRYTAAEAREKLERILKRATQTDQLPAFAAVLAAGFKLLQRPLFDILSTLNTLLSTTWQRSPRAVDRFARFIAAGIGAAAAFSLLNGPPRGPNVKSEYGKTVAFDMEFSDNEDEETNTRKKAKRSKIPPSYPPVPFDDAFTTNGVLSTKGIPLAGQTMDFTVFAFIRAMDVLVQLPRNNQKPGSSPPRNKFTALAAKTGTPLLFILSSAVIMNAWFYAPHRLPISYTKWIDRIAELDERLMYCLRQIRFGNFIYGKDTGMAPLLGSFATDCNLPEEFGDPTKSIPCPCELVHHGVSASCEQHALWRFYRGWRKALGVYLPLQLIILQRRIRNQRCGRGLAVIDAVRNASRNSAFLGAFVSLMYYGVCLGRTRLGPKLFPHISPGEWDGGLAVLWGCALCGFSILLENARRQTELMLFVLPRAVAVWFPKRYPKELLWREQTVFALSAAIVLTASSERPDKVRGVLGRILASLNR